MIKTITLDQQKVEQIKQNNQVVIKATYLDYRASFFAWLQKKYNCDLEICKDVYQLSFMVFIENIQTGKLSILSSTLKVYFFGIGKNIYRDYQRKNNNISLLKDDLLFDRADIANQKESSYQQREVRLQQLAKALLKLGEPCKTLLENFYYLQMSMQEIAEKLDYKNTHSARNQKYKCVERLKKIVAK